MRRPRLRRPVRRYPAPCSSRRSGRTRTPLAKAELLNSTASLMGAARRSPSSAHAEPSERRVAHSTTRGLPEIRASRGMNRLAHQGCSTRRWAASNGANTVSACPGATHRPPLPGRGRVLRWALLMAGSQRRHHTTRQCRVRSPRRTRAGASEGSAAAQRTLWGGVCLRPCASGEWRRGCRVSEAVGRSLSAVMRRASGGEVAALWTLWGGPVCGPCVGREGRRGLPRIGGCGAESVCGHAPGARGGGAAAYWTLSDGVRLKPRAGLSRRRGSRLSTGVACGAE